MKINESQLREIIRETIEESLWGLSLDNRIKNGHWHENSKSPNKIIQAAWKLGWELTKKDGNEAALDGVYDAKVMSGQFNNIELDRSINGVKHPKASWPILIKELRREFGPMGYFVNASNYHNGYENLFGKEVNDGGAKMIYGTITVGKAQ